MRLPARKPAPAPVQVSIETDGSDATSFAELGLSPEVVAALGEAGIETPFPIQARTIREALAGRDICGKAPTGSGKTLAFGLPLIERLDRCQPRRPAALVLVPTRELANQAARTLQPLARTRGLRTVALYGGVPVNRHHELLKTQIDLVIATPGRLNDLLERGSISLSAVSMVVIDEADQMADMGFLPQVERILRQAPSGYQVLLFSATLDGEVDRLIRRYQQDPVHVAVEVEASQEEAMLHRFIAVQDDEKAAVAADIVAGPERSLLFTRTQRGADRAARLLSRLGVRCGVLHGGVSQSQRERVLRAFEDGSVPVMVATNVAARGLHIDGIETVIHYDVPEEDKVFIHRSGRTARAGATGLVVTLVQLEQLRDVDALRLRSGRREQIVGMSPGDERLRDLRAWDPPLDPERTEEPASAKQQRGAFAGAPRRWSRGPVRARHAAGVRR